MYPCVDLDVKIEFSKPEFLCKSAFLTSLNRYERKKSIETAIETFAAIENPSIKLVIAGGYDPRLDENVEYLQELQKVCENFGLKWTQVRDWSLTQDADVYFLTNLTDDQKEAILQNTDCLLYTPQFEHFGIVPIEAMGRGAPVLAWKNGGPTETIVHKSTGFLAETRDEWTEGLRFLLESNRSEMGQRGKLHVAKHFSLHKMKRELDNLISSLN